MNLLKPGVGVAALVLLLSACGGGDGSPGRPSSDDLAQAIRSGSSGLGVSEEKADCVAKVLVESDLSDDALRRYTGDNDADKLDDADRKAFDEALSSMQDRCQASQGAV